MRKRRAELLGKIIFVGCIVCVQIALGAAPSQDRSASAKSQSGSDLRRARHVVIVVWDGMRPDFVSPQNTPALWKLAQGGVSFRKHHPVYPSATIVNGTAINTGAYPNHSSIGANYDYRPEIDSKGSINVESADAVRKGDGLSGGKYIALPTIAESIHAAGGKTAVAAAKTVGLLFDRRADGRRGQNIFAGESLPHDAVTEIVKKLGAFPAAAQAADRDNWTTNALTDFLWRDHVPTFSLLWLSEPDDTEHKTAPGAPGALAAMKSSDENLAHVVAALDRHHLGEETDLFVVSDHGFSTIERSVDVRKILKDAGFDAVTEFTTEPKPSQIMIVGEGGSVLFYVIGHDPVVARRLVEFLQQSDFAGVIFSREKMEGTLSLDIGKIDSDHAPDVEMAFRWNENKNQFGIAGMIDADWQRGAGQGTHATLSRFEMNNMLIAAGPDFRHGEFDDLPTGNVDLAPTILQILGIKPEAKMDGRVLSEAMTNGQPLKSEAQTIESTRKFPDGTWRQYLTISRVGATEYLDEGNGAFTR